MYCITPRTNGTITFKNFMLENTFLRVKVRVVVLNANNISVTSWLSVLLVEETRVPEENHKPAASR